MIETKQKKTIKNFPTTRYQGSKRKILKWLHDNLKDLEFETVLDAFGGTSAVSYLFKLMGKEVTFNDELRFNHVIAKAIVENDGFVLSSDEINAAINVDGIQNHSSFIADNFSDIYFTDSENLWIDRFLYNINFNPIFSGDLEEIKYKKSIALFALFQASMTKRPYNLFHRKNLYMRLNDVDRNFGNKTTWERSFNDQVKKFILEANEAVFEGEKKCKSINRSAFDIDNPSYDLVYIDPPYVDKNGDHDTVDYLYCYHFLEGISRYEEWSELIDYNTKNLRFRRDLHSTGFKRRNVLESFDKLFEKFQDSIIVVSYKKNGIPSIEEIIEVLSKYKRTIRQESMHYIYALNKQNGNAKENREVLLIGY